MSLFLLSYHFLKYLNNKMCLYENSCRACLSTENETLPIFSTDLSIMFKSCTRLQVDAGDGLPTGLCLICANRLKDLYSFLKQCLHSDYTLRTQMQPNNMIIKDESVLDEPFDSDLSQGDTCTDFPFVNKTLIMKEPTRNLITGNETVKKTIRTNEKHDVSNPAAGKTSEKIIDSKSSHEKSVLKRNRKGNRYIYKCEKCPRKFKTKERCDSHTGTHYGKPEAECKLCGKVFHKWFILEQHMVRHTGKREFVCQHCGKEFYFVNPYKMHLRTHNDNGGRLYICEECGKGYRTSSELRIHKSIHTEDAPFQCNQCPKAFKNNGCLQAHLRRHANIRNHICAICGKATLTPAELRIHMRSHSDTKPFCCDICHKRFKGNSQLKQHVATHSGIKKHKCKTCEKLFSTTTTLKTHQRVHTGEKPFVCEICDKAFSQNSALKTHVKIHSKLGSLGS